MHVLGNENARWDFHSGSVMLSDKLGIAAFVLSFESVTSQFQFLRRRPFPFKAISICRAYTNISDAIALMISFQSTPCAKISKVQTVHVGL